MKARFGRNLVCQKCGKDDKICTNWHGRNSYNYWCVRCDVTVKEVDRSSKK